MTAIACSAATGAAGAAAAARLGDQRDPCRPHVIGLGPVQRPGVGVEVVVAIVANAVGWCPRARQDDAATGARPGAATHLDARWPRAVCLGPEQGRGGGIDVVVAIVADAVGRIDRAGQDGVPGRSGIAGTRHRNPCRPHAVCLGPEQHPGHGIQVEVPVFTDLGPGIGGTRQHGAAAGGGLRCGRCWRRG